MTQRLILLFDGTWNDPEDQTNVYRLTRRIQDYDGTIRQRFFYDPGVGTSSFERFSGGVFGYGLSRNLLEGYEWLAKRYSEGEEIWIFGFSRGAYTARSLVGLIRKCGLLHIVTPCLLKKAEKIYRNDSLAPDSEECRAFRETYSRSPRIHFIGVWDTVGALGVPGTLISEHGKFAWHDTELSSIVDRAYHAVALDEHRATYDVPLWTSDDGKQKPRNLEVEQRWFIGAHANVGGGYGSDDRLADISLQWMLGKAEKAGLKLDRFTAAEDAWKTEPRDSFQEFLKGGYAWFQKIRRGEEEARFSRRYAEDKKGRPAVNISIDESVWQRWQDAGLNYRPPTLTDAGQSPPEPLVIGPNTES
ncbi:DUF2235 domain-containing protein [Halopseudomonas salina]|uniref:T6SS Phospholipase effector Tle1-like catalytic domain-containing protein n=1 Tax=Halopseudomonas salina TaxID=1323744 RepID=A0ABQ1NT96_9GAMM|nr:DUF2235 domain-containing protein [Halopseudomonas salina]GGC84326.1 hypothetical protein GCM10007418_00210 [Halopseudomonas salina]